MMTFIKVDDKANAIHMYKYIEVAYRAIKIHAHTHTLTHIGRRLTIVARHCHRHSYNKNHNSTTIRTESINKISMFFFRLRHVYSFHFCSRCSRTRTHTHTRVMCVSVYNERMRKQTNSGAKKSNIEMCHVDNGVNELAKQLLTDSPYHTHTQYTGIRYQSCSSSRNQYTR